MIYSMTAFARQCDQGSFGNISVEIKTVNHRYLEISTRLPENFRHLEMRLRTLVRDHVTRGKVDLTIKFQAGSALDTTIDINTAMAKQLITAAQDLQGYIDNPQAISVTDLFRVPGVVQMREVDTSQLGDSVLSLTKRTLTDLISVREGEGEKLKGMIVDRLHTIGEQVQALQPLIPQLLDEQKKKLIKRIDELSVTVDQGRLEQELVILAQRIDVTEEMDRLHAHLQEVESVLNKGGRVGRRLDFLMQELNREANTLGAKSIAVKSSHASVDMKVLIEQMREQVQNIE